MKIYFKNYDTTFNVNIVNYHLSKNDFFVIEFMVNNKLSSCFLKEGRTKNFYSHDGITWHVLNKNFHLSQISMGDQLLNLHYGFIPNQQGEEQEGTLIAKMPGKVVKILKAEGDVVTKGESLLIIEAMKMENEIKANCSGAIDKIYVTSGQSINSGELLISLKTTTV